MATTWPGLHIEGNVRQRSDATRVLEVRHRRIALRPRPGRSTRVRRFLDHGLGVEDVERHPQADEVVLQRAHRVADGLERFVDGGDIRKHDEQFTRSDAALEWLVGTQAEHHCRADRRRRIHGKREEGLPHGDVDARIDGLGCFRAETAEFVVLTLKCRDHRKHGHRVVHDRETVGLHAFDVRAVAAGYGSRSSGSRSTGAARR